MAMMVMMVIIRVIAMMMVMAMVMVMMSINCEGRYIVVMILVTLFMFHLKPSLISDDFYLTKNTIFSCVFSSNPLQYLMCSLPRPLCGCQLDQVPILVHISMLIYPPLPHHYHHYWHHHQDHHLCLIIITTIILSFIDLSRAISSSAHVFHYSANQFLGHTTSQDITPFF